MKENRLNGLALLNTHPGIDCPIDYVLSNLPGRIDVENS